MKGNMMKKLMKYFKKVDGQSLAEFAVTTAMMATLATTAAPKFSGVGEGAKEKKTLADVDKILKSANNFYNSKVTSDSSSSSSNHSNVGLIQVPRTSAANNDCKAAVLDCRL